MYMYIHVLTYIILIKNAQYSPLHYTLCLSLTKVYSSYLLHKYRMYKSTWYD